MSYHGQLHLAMREAGQLDEQHGPDDCADEASPFFVDGLYVADVFLAERYRRQRAEAERDQAARLYAFPASVLEAIQANEGAPFFDRKNHAPGKYYHRCGWPLLTCATCEARTAA